MKKRIATCIMLILVMMGCTRNQAISDLEIVLAGIEAALPVISVAANVNPSTQQVIATYLQAVSTATMEASAILDSPGTAAQKAAQITALFAGIAAPTLSPGTAQSVILAVQVVAQSVSKFLADIRPTLGSGKMQAVVISPTAGEHKLLMGIRVRAAGDQVKISALHR